jgi:hypothetical protein
VTLFRDAKKCEYFSGPENEGSATTLYMYVLAEGAVSRAGVMVVIS